MSESKYPHSDLKMKHKSVIKPLYLVPVVRNVGIKRDSEHRPLDWANVNAMKIMLERYYSIDYRDSCENQGIFTWHCFLCLISEQIVRELYTFL